ncbi:MAG: Ig-like domain-containing protein, partial [bacterium]|nr:Ig-like domain-containing protein [bacterium]
MTHAHPRFSERSVSRLPSRISLVRYTAIFAFGCTLFFAGTAHAAITEVGAGATNSGTGTAVSVTHGMPILANDVVVAFIHANNTGNIITNTNGSTPFTQAIQENTADTSRYAIFTRVAGGSELASYAWTLATSANWTIIVRVFRGVDTSALWDVAPSAATRTLQCCVSGSTAVAPSLSINTANALGIAYFFSDSSAGLSFSVPTNGYGSEVERTSPTPQATYTRVWSATGPTGSTSATMSAANDDQGGHQFSLRPAVTLQTLSTALRIAGEPAEAGNLANPPNGTMITPAITPAGFTGTVVRDGTGSVTFAPAQVGNGVFFTSCCLNTNNAYYKFTGQTIGNVFNANQGEIDFYVKSAYSWAERNTAGSSASQAHYVFDVRDDDMNNHPFYFFIQPSVGQLGFTYRLGGTAPRTYLIPQGQEDATFGKNVIAKVRLTWDGATQNLFINDILIQSTAYVKSTPSWTSRSTFNLGAYEFQTFGGYNVSDDTIDEFIVLSPSFTQVVDATPPTVSITGPANGSAVSGIITVSANASDNIGVAGVQFKLDGANLGTEDTVSPYAVSWDTATVAAGTHTLTAAARDTAGNMATAAAVTVTTGSVAPPSNQFVIGDRVQTTAVLNVRATPATAGTLLGTQTTGAQGAVIGGPIAADGFTWWNINYDTGVDGWSVEDYLAKVITTGTTYYLSPTGLDTNTGLSQTAPFKTFAKAFSVLPAGGELVLLDGTYGVAQGTGIINWDTSAYGANTAQIPSGISRSQMTYIHALNPGNVKIMGELFIGRSFRKDSYIKIEGITFEGGGSLYNTSYVIVRNSGFHDVTQGTGSVFGIGSGDHTQGNTFNLIEDVWIWGQDRLIAINYRADNNVWRRVLVRGDGCNSASCTNSGGPNVGITVYESKNVSLQNVFVVDRILNGGTPYGDFATAMHTSGFPFGNNEWLGTISLNAPDVGYYFEADIATLSPTRRVRNAIAWNSFGAGFNVQSSGNTDVQNGTFKTSGGSSDSFRLRDADSSSDVITNIIALGNGRDGVNTIADSNYVDVYGTWSDAAYRPGEGVCLTGCKTSDPLADGSLKYITRIENGSPLKGTSAGGADYGANVMYRYGTDGSFWGDAGYNALTTNQLWPFSNEARIKKEMCTDTGVTRGFCSSGSLTQYIWEAAGSSMPADLYGTVSSSGTYYISPTGSDTSGNGSAGSPWATFSKAWTVLQPGNTLIVANGNYTTPSPPPGKAG